MADRDYYFLGNGLLSLIFCIIPITSLIFGIATRFKEGKIVAALVRLFLGWNIIWILDIISMVFSKKIFRLLNF